MIFVLGTRDGVGKTVVATTLLGLADKLGVAAAGMKPAQTGCSYTDDHDLYARDGEALREASRHALPPLVTSPYRFGTPGAPAVAAARAGMSLTLDDLEVAIRAADANIDLLVVEGPGGIETAVAEDGTTGDLAARVAATTIIVADVTDDIDRVLARVDLPIAGVIVMGTGGPSHPRVLAALPRPNEGVDLVAVLEAANLGSLISAL